MRYDVSVVGVLTVLVCAGVCPQRASAGLLVLAQTDGGGIGGSLASPAARTVRAKPRPSRAAAPRSRPAPRVIVKREVVYQPRYITRPDERRSAGRGSGVARYDGVWSVSSNGCSGAGTSQVMISGGHVTGNGGGGNVSPSGAVTTMSSFNGITVMGQGQITGRFATGAFRQSDGCAGSWSAVKL